MMMRESPVSTWTEHLNLLSLASADMHTSQLQPTSGTPVDVPVPKNRTFIFYCSGKIIKATRFNTGQLYYLLSLVGKPVFRSFSI
jgi:hypothetical protein